MTQWPGLPGLLAVIIRARLTRSAQINRALAVIFKVFLWGFYLHICGHLLRWLDIKSPSNLSLVKWDLRKGLSNNNFHCNKGTILKISHHNYTPNIVLKILRWYVKPIRTVKHQEFGKAIRPLFADPVTYIVNQTKLPNHKPYTVKFWV